MTLAPLPHERFARFHQAFRGDSPDIFQACRVCGGKCEYAKISTLLPGEAEYMAAQQGLDSAAFRDRYLDGVEIDGVVLDVLKLVDPCPFLSAAFTCQCRSFKPVFCEIYPIVFSLEGQRPAIEIDDWCLLARDPRYKPYFRDVGVPAVEALGIPLEWLRRVIPYDELYFDYLKLQATRERLGVPAGRYWVISCEALLAHTQEASAVRAVLDR
ncbi:MAG: YkgJ family cysteine cluster protein [Pseudomonadota bacterium]